jgi:polar amino acid transport system substrate-binding protein
MKHHLRVLAVTAGLALALVACSTPSQSALDRSLAPLPSPPTTAAPTTTTTPPPCTSDPTASFAPGDVTAAQARAELGNPDHLVVGVDQATYGWDFRDPRTGELSGLEVDLLERISQELFGPDHPLVFRTVTTAGRIPAVQQGDVDMVASQLSATCARQKLVDLSTIYYEAHQDVLVDNYSDIHSLQDLAGRKVCATQGSTSIQNIIRLVPTAKIHAVPTRSDCLVLLQEGTVDAITSDDTILRAFQRQEVVPQTRQLGLSAATTELEPYAIAMQHGHDDLTRFVNGVLDRMRADGSLQQLYDKWLGPDAPATVPAARYR